ncbi:MAG: bifunctional metallophosphatase/5'-nucleotidase [Elusimicrobiaceae bacterium]|nr:bifunctional metallophosphatase/5'-nucleotidase [Elusimicrobiaceae bacterium]
MKRLLLVAVLLFPVVLFAKTTTIYHTSDTHGFFYPKNGQGGFAAMAAVLKSGPKDYLLLDSGDFSNGTVEAKNSKGLKAVEFMNEMGYHASTLGNHEFDFTEEALPAILAKANFTVLAANFFEKDTQKHPEGILPYKIFEVDGTKIAVIGLGNRNPTKKTVKYMFSKTLEAFENALVKAEKENPDVVVVVVHDSLQDDKYGVDSYVGDIGRQFSGRVHIVFGGHAHKIFQNTYEKGVLFVESGNNIQYVSKVSVTTDDKTGKFLSAKSELIPLLISKVGQDEKILAVGERLREPGVDEIVGNAPALISKKPSIEGHRDGPLDNWISDLGKKYTGAEVFIHNTGGTRVDMPQGPITKRDLIDIHPFDNTVTEMTVSGRFLKSVVKSGLVPWNRFAFSGLTVTYKVNKKGKVKNLKIWVNGKRLKNRQMYKIATNSYIAGGGSEGYLFKQIPEEEKHLVGVKTIRDMMEDGLRAGIKEIPATGRIIEK